MAKNKVKSRNIVITNVTHEHIEVWEQKAKSMGMTTTTYFKHVCQNMLETQKKEEHKG